MHEEMKIKTPAEMRVTMLEGSTCGGAERRVFFVKWGQWGR